MTKITSNIVKVGVHWYLPNAKINLWSKFNSEKFAKSDQVSMGIQIYDQVLILRSWSKAKLHRAVLLGFVLKESKITLNIMKVGLHSYLPNAHLNLWLNFNSKKLVKSETLSLTFLCVPLKWLSKSSFKFDF